MTYKIGYCDKNGKESHSWVLFVIPIVRALMQMALQMTVTLVLIAYTSSLLDVQTI